MNRILDYAAVLLLCTFGGLAMLVGLSGFMFASEKITGSPDAGLLVGFPVMMAAATFVVHSFLTAKPYFGDR